MDEMMYENYLRSGPSDPRYKESTVTRFMEMEASYK